MNDFMNALWNATGSTVTGVYNSKPFIGVIANVRTKAGNDVALTVTTEEGDTVMLKGTELLNGSGVNTTNLHVYF